MCTVIHTELRPKADSSQHVNEQSCFFWGRSWEIISSNSEAWVRPWSTASNQRGQNNQNDGNTPKKDKSVRSACKVTTYVFWEAKLLVDYLEKCHTITKTFADRQSPETKIRKIRCRELEEECSSTRTGRAEGQCRWLPSRECGFCRTCQTPAILTWFSTFRLLPLSQDEVGSNDDDAVGAVDHFVEVQYANL